MTADEMARDPETLRAIRERHRKTLASGGGWGEDLCEMGDPWPCDVALVLRAKKADLIGAATPDASALRTLARLVAVVDAAEMRWRDPVPADAIDAIRDAKELLVRAALASGDTEPGGTA